MESESPPRLNGLLAEVALAFSVLKLILSPVENSLLAPLSLMDLLQTAPRPPILFPTLGEVVVEILGSMASLRLGTLLESSNFSLSETQVPLATQLIHLG